jgi:hypothetical protein
LREKLFHTDAETLSAFARRIGSAQWKPSQHVKRAGMAAVRQQQRNTVNGGGANELHDGSNDDIAREHRAGDGGTAVSNSECIFVFGRKGNAVDYWVALKHNWWTQTTRCLTPMRKRFR